MEKWMNLLTEELGNAFEKAGYDRNYGKVVLSNRPDLCEYQCNGAMAGAKVYRMAPVQIAAKVVEQMEGSQVFSSAEAVNPGFINLKASPEFLAAYLRKMAEDEHLSVAVTDTPKTILID